MLLEGETGTGKCVTARSIHMESSRASTASNRDLGAAVNGGQFREDL